MKRCHWYWFEFRSPLRVVVDLEETHHYDWSRIHGIQIGPWFFGAIKGVRADL